MNKRARGHYTIAHEDRLNSPTAFLLMNIWAGLFLFAAWHGWLMG
jgi:hypothetical protein